MRILKMYPAVLIQQNVEEGDETGELDEEREELPDYKDLSSVFERGIEKKPATRRGAPTSPTLSARMSTGGVPSLLQEIMESENALDSYREDPRRKMPEISNFGREGGSRPIERQNSTRVKASKTGAGKSPCLSAKISHGGIPSMLEVNSSMCRAMPPPSQRWLPLPFSFSFSLSHTLCLFVFASLFSFSFFVSNFKDMHDAFSQGCRIIDSAMSQEAAY
jgi:hypothetical protein